MDPNIYKDILINTTTVSTDVNSPVYEHFKKNGNANLAEIIIHNYIYCYLFLIEEKIISDTNNDFSRIYFSYTYIQISKIIPDLSIEEFHRIFKERFVPFKSELELLRDNADFPIIYFNRILNSPLSLGQVDINQQLNTHLDKEFLLKMFRWHCYYLHFLLKHSL